MEEQTTQNQPNTTKTEVAGATTTTPSATAAETTATTTAAVVARTHQAKDLSAKSLWTAHGVGGAILLVAIACVVFAKGPTRAQALAALAKKG